MIRDVGGFSYKQLLNEIFQNGEETTTKICEEVKKKVLQTRNTDEIFMVSYHVRTE